MNFTDVERVLQSCTVGFDDSDGDLLEEVCGPEFGAETQYLRVSAGRLRRKLGDDPVAPRLVTAPGVGYRLVDPEPDA